MLWYSIVGLLISGICAFVILLLALGWGGTVTGIWAYWILTWMIVWVVMGIGFLIFLLGSIALAVAAAYMDRFYI